jgi:O-antigen/teichoic acid export membrane protein
MRLSTFKRGFASTFALDVTARGMSAVTTVLLLRALDVEGFAFIVLMLSAGHFLGGAATDGLRLRYVRTEAERVSRGEAEQTSFWLTLRAGTLLIVAATTLALLVASALGVGGSWEDRAGLYALGTAFTLAHATVELAVFHHQAQLAFTRATLIWVLRSTVMLICALGATAGLLQTGEHVGLAFAISVGLVALAVAGPVAWETRHSIVGKEGRLGFGRESLALTFYSVASAGRAYATVFLVAALLDDAAVASYGAALRYVAVVRGPIPALISVVRVRTAQRDMIDSEEAQARMLKNWAKRSAPLALLGLGAAAIAAPFAIPIVDGGRYPLSIPLFEILLLGAFVTLVTLPAPALLITQRRFALLGWINAAALVANAVLAVAFAPGFGVVGVTVVGTLVTVAQFVGLAYLAGRVPARAARPEIPAEAHT